MTYQIYLTTCFFLLCGLVIFNFVTFQITNAKIKKIFSTLSDIAWCAIISFAIIESFQFIDVISGLGLWIVVGIIGYYMIKEKQSSHNLRNN